MKFYCQRCKAEVGEHDRKLKVERQDVCPKCGVSLHACVMCRHFDRNVNNQCRIPGTEWVADRERSNFCDEFEFITAGPGADTDQGPSVQDKVKDELDKLFGG